LVVVGGEIIEAGGALRVPDKEPLSFSELASIAGLKVLGSIGGWAWVLPIYSSILFFLLFWQS
jgi:hypothetical protein